MREKQPKINHLERRGYRSSSLLVAQREDLQRHLGAMVEIVGRRSRKVWPCKSPTCALGRSIELDDIYVEVSGNLRYGGIADRWHIVCALRAQLIEPFSEKVDITNDRRAAIEEVKARKELTT